MKLKNSEFLLDQRHKAMVAGKSRRLYGASLNKLEWLTISAPLVIVAILLFLMVFVASFGPQIPSQTLVFVVIFAIFLFFSYQLLVKVSAHNYPKIYQRWKRIRKLKKQGVLLEGKIISCNLDTEHLLKVHYGFRNPSDKFIEGEISRKRLDLEAKTIPDPGVFVTVLYVDDDCFTLL